MKKTTSGQSAFSVIELMLVIVLIVVLLGFSGVTLMKNRAKADRIRCVGHLKQTTLALKIFASDNNDRYPYQRRPPRTNATALATIALTNAVPAGPASPLFPGQTQQAAWAHWGYISNELGSPKILVCPPDGSRRNVATEWSTDPRRGFYSARGHARMSGPTSHLLDRPDYGQDPGYDTSVSYFICFDAEETVPDGIFVGDSCLEWDGRAADPFHANPRGAGVQALTSTNDFAQLTFVMGTDGRGWNRHDKEGNIGMTDGSVMQVNASQLRQAVWKSTNAWRKTSMHLLLPR